MVEFPIDLVKIRSKLNNGMYCSLHEQYAVKLPKHVENCNVQIFCINISTFFLYSAFQFTTLPTRPHIYQFLPTSRNISDNSDIRPNPYSAINRPPTPYMFLPCTPITPRNSPSIQDVSTATTDAPLQVSTPTVLSTDVVVYDVDEY